VVKVIWHKAASPLHTDGSVVFARYRQYALPSTTPQSASAPCRCCPPPTQFSLSISTAEHPGMSIGFKLKVRIHHL